MRLIELLIQSNLQFDFLIQELGNLIAWANKIRTFIQICKVIQSLGIRLNTLYNKIKPLREN